MSITSLHNFGLFNYNQIKCLVMLYFLIENIFLYFFLFLTSTF
jgi:hypothetical protein